MMAALARKPDAAPAAKAKAKTSQGSLRIGAPDDAFEREADRVASAVMAGGRNRLDWSFSRTSITPPLQRKCACGGSGGPEGECEDCKQKKTLQRKATSPAAVFDPVQDFGDHAPAIVDDVLRSPGQPLDHATRGFFESRFGHDFGSVRVHADARAGASARAVDSLAYTVGSDLVFASGHYAPGTARGDSLIAHELTHVVQQSGGRLQRKLQRQRCGHDGRPTKCGASNGVWKLIDQVTDEAGLFSVDTLILEGGLKRFGGGQWIGQVQTPANPVKKKDAARGRADAAKVMVGTSLDVEIVEIKSRSDDGGGCVLATQEADGYVSELRAIAPLIVPISQKLAAVGGLKVEGGKCKSPKAAEKKILTAAGVDFNNASSVNAWCFYNSLQDRLNRVFATPFTAVNVRANADGAVNTSYQVPPPIVINCRKTKSNPKGLGLRFLEFQVNQKGGASYGCYDVCQDKKEEEEKRKEDTVQDADKKQKTDAFRDSAKYPRLDLPLEKPQPGAPQPGKPVNPNQINVQPSDPNSLTPQDDTGEGHEVQLPPGGISELDALKATAEVISTVAALHVAARALRSKAERDAARALAETVIERGTEKGALNVAEHLDGVRLARLGEKSYEVVLKDGEEVLVKASPRLLAKLGPNALKGLTRAAPIIAIVLAANDARAAISHIRKGGTIELGPSLNDVDLSGDTKVKSNGPGPTRKPSGDVSLKDTVIDIETNTAPNISGTVDIDTNNVTIHGASLSDGSPVTVNMKMKLSNTTITFKNTGVYQDGKILAGDMDVTDSQIEIDLPPGAVDPGRQAGQSTTIKGAKIKVTSLGGGGGGGAAGQPGAKPSVPSGGAAIPGPAAGPATTPPASTPAGKAPASTPAAAPPLAGPDRPVLIQQIQDDPDLLRLHVALIGTEGVVPSDEMLRRFIALKPLLKRHPAAVDAVIKALKPGQINDPIKDIIEPIERKLNDEDEKLRKDLEKTAAGTPPPAAKPGTPPAPGTPGKAPDPATPPPGPGSDTAPLSGAASSAPPGKLPAGSGPGQSAAAGPKTTSVAFSAIKNQLVWPIHGVEATNQPLPAITFVVEWTANAGNVTLTYKIPLSLTMIETLPHGNYVWAANYAYTAPQGTFTTAEGDLPIQFSDANTGHYVNAIYQGKPRQGKPKK